MRNCVFLLIAFLVASCGALVKADGVDPACGASPEAGRPQYIVGYGSLMQEESRKRTTPGAGPAHPVEVAGYRRGWIARGESIGFGTTFLGVRPDQGNRFNAVMYEVNAAEVGATDRRESSYCRQMVATADIRMFEPGFSLAPGAQVWIYVTPPNRVALPSPRYPIVESYVDIFVSGCLEQEQLHGLSDFSRQCLDSTYDWSVEWVNDRIYPRRPFIYQPKAAQIDKLLAARLGAYFSTIRIEGSH